MQPLEIPEGMDDNNSCRVVIDVSSFSSVEDGRVVYQKGRPLEWWVDSEEYSIIDMEKDVCKHFSWASYQEANFWFVDSNGQTRRLGTDHELLTLLRASKNVKFIMTVDRCDHVNVDVEDQSQVIDEGNELQVLATYEGDLTQAPSRAVAAEYEGLELLEEPELGVSAAGPARVEEEEKEHYMEPGFDPDGDDPIGADEEWRYFKKKQKEPERESSAKVQHEKKKMEKKGKVCEEIDSDVVPSDEATMLKDAGYVAHTTYDRDNPEIKVGSTFVDKASFILIIKQYAIKREFHTFVEHSDKERYRARCADSECDWKVHAKKLRGCPTFMIVSISDSHACASTSQVKGKEASKGWIADRAKDILSFDKSVTAKKLKLQLEQQFPIRLSYNKVWEGMPLWQISGKPCTHAVSFICSLRKVKLEDYVHDYYSLDRFKATYQFEVNPMVGKSQWRVIDPGFEMLPPKLERAAGRPRVKRIKSRGEPGKRGPYQCKRCFQFGHIEKGCREPPTELGAELPPSLPTKSRKRKGETSTSKGKNVSKKSKKSGTASTSTSLVTQAPLSPGTTTRTSTPTSPGPTTRRMAASTSTPTSPGPTTRRMTAQLNISPGGIDRRVIIN